MNMDNQEILKLMRQLAYLENKASALFEWAQKNESIYVLDNAATMKRELSELKHQFADKIIP